MVLSPIVVSGEPEVALPVCSIHELEQSEENRYHVLVLMKPLEMQYESCKKELSTQY